MWKLVVWVFKCYKMKHSKRLLNGLINFNVEKKKSIKYFESSTGKDLMF